MPRPQSTQTVLRHLRAVLKRAENWDCTSLAEDQAIRHAIDAVARSLDSRELATVLAALRTYQICADHHVRLPISPDQQQFLADIETNMGAVDPLTSHEIDDLCERLNCGG